MSLYRRTTAFLLALFALTAPGWLAQASVANSKTEISGGQVEKQGDGDVYLQMAQARAEPLLSEATPARGVRDGKPVEPGAVFTPDVNPVYVWFRIDGATTSTKMRSVWHYLGAGTDSTIGEGEFTVPAGSRWANVKYTLAAGKRWPLGDYRVDIMIGDKQAGRLVASVPFRVADASAQPKIVEARPAHGVRDGKPLEPGEVFAPSAKEIFIWFRISGVNAPTKLRSVWNYIAADGEQFIIETEATLVPGHEWGDFRVEGPPGRPWPTGEYRVDLLIGDTKAISVPFRVVDNVARPTIVATRVARGVRDGLPVDPREVFAPDAGKIYVWFRMAGHSAPTKLRGVWHFIGGGGDQVIVSSEVTIQPNESWGDFNMELPPGRPWPKGEYRFDIMIGEALAVSVPFRVAAATPLDDAIAAYNKGDYATALQLLTPLAEQGTAAAQYNLGVMYEYGRGVPQSFAEAVKWYQKAADQGYALAQNDLASMYENGRGVPQDFAESVKWYQKAVDQGAALAQFNLGRMYSDGRGVPQNYAEAVKWYQKAADQGVAVAQNNLGAMYSDGRGVPQNYAEAVKWYQKAADQSFAAAQYNLGVKYENGRGVPQNYAEAVKWYQKAADQGDADAQSNLGGMYANGDGVPKDYVRALMWLNLSAAQGNQNAVKNRNIVAGGMTPVQIAEAQKLTREWKPTTPPPR